MTVTVASGAPTGGQGQTLAFYYDALGNRWVLEDTRFGTRLSSGKTAAQALQSARDSQSIGPGTFNDFSALATYADSQQNAVILEGIRNTGGINRSSSIGYRSQAAPGNTGQTVVTEKRDSVQQNIETSGQATTEVTQEKITSPVEAKKINIGNQLETGVSTQPVYNPDHPMADADGYIWPTRGNAPEQKYSMAYAPDHPNADADGYVTVSRPLAPGETVGTGVDASLIGSFESAESAGPSREDSGENDTAAEQTVARTTQQATPQQTGTLLNNLNPLFELSDYTYSFILAALTPDVFNKIMTDPGYKYVKNNVIIASGSRRGENLNRNENFLYDFYIQELKFDSIIGLNSRTKGSNVLGINFKIVEPLGASFFERLYVMANELGIRNYLEIPYMLIVEFRGNDVDGNPVVLTEHTKFIPIKILGARMKITGAGSEYNIEATPFNQVAYQATEHGSTPVNVQIKSSTVGEFFANNNNIDELAKEIVNDQRELARDIERRKATVNIGFEVVDPEEIKRGINKRVEESRKKFYNAASYVQALNSFQLRLKELEKVAQIDTYSFVVDPEIAKSAIVQPNLSPSNRSSFPNSANTGSQATAVETSTQKVFPVNAGTSIVDVINTIMKNSDYIRSQLTDKSSKIKPGGSPQDVANAEGKPLKWYKILPVVTIKDFDFKRNTYARSIEYHIIPYIVHNTKSPLVSKSLPKKWIQEYKYIFTGDNQSIIDLDINFEVMFYTLATASREQWESMNSAAGAPSESDLNSGHNRSNSFQPNKIVHSSMNMSDQIGSYDTDTAKGIAVSELYNSLYSSQRGDMINVRLKIVGDPRYIKQDELFFNPVNAPKLGKELVSKNNSVIFDYEERYVNLIFFTPIDYDSETGLLAKDSKFLTSKFSGLYRILRVENTFQRGKFEQTLDLVRLFDQESDASKTERRAAETLAGVEAGIAGIAPNNKREETGVAPDTNQSAAETARLSRQLPVGDTSTLSVPNTPAVAAALTNTTPPTATDLASDPNTNYNETPSSGISDQEKLEALRKYNEENNESREISSPDTTQPQSAGPVPIDTVKSLEQAVAGSERLITEAKALDEKLSAEFNSPPSRRDVGRELKAAQDSGADPATIAQLQEKFDQVSAEKAEISLEIAQNSKKLADLEYGLIGNRDRLNEAKIKAANATITRSSVSRTPSIEDAG